MLGVWFGTCHPPFENFFLICIVKILKIGLQLPSLPGKHSYPSDPQNNSIYACLVISRSFKKKLDVFFWNWRYQLNILVQWHKLRITLISINRIRGRLYIIFHKLILNSDFASLVNQVKKWKKIDRNWQFLISLLAKSNLLL